MCLPIDQSSLLCWLKTQVRVLEAWREDAAMDPEPDVETIGGLERHYAWLTGEIARLEARLERRAA